MPTTHLLPEDIRDAYLVHEWRNATGVLMTACPEEWTDIIEVLRAFRLRRSEIEAAGKNRSPIARQIDQAFVARGWIEKKFATTIEIDGQRYDSPTHSVDCFKGKVALEVEWNNKDPFFDRDLNNFRLLFELRAIDVGIIVTPSTDLETSLMGSARAHHTAPRPPTIQS